MLSPDFKEFIQSLNDREVRYLVVGGYAVALHGHPRYTKDLDVWLDNSLDNAEKAIEAIKQFGFESVGLTSQDFLARDQVVQLGYPPNRIDLLTSADGVEFASCYASRVSAVIDGTTINFIDLDNLKKNKRATSRPQDLADLDALEG